MSNEEWEDSAITTVRNLCVEGNLITSLHLCSALVEHYCRTRLFIFLMDIRPLELIEVKDKITKKMKKKPRITQNSQKKRKNKKE